MDDGDEAPRVPTTVAFTGLAAALTVLTLAGAVPPWSGLVHQAALPPLDLFADVRLLTARSTSYPAFVAGLVASVGIRSVVVAVALGGFSVRRMAFVLRFYLLALPAAVVAGALAFSGIALSYAWFVWAAIAITLLGTLALAPVVWAGAPDLRQAIRWPIGHRRHAGIVALYVVAVAAVGTVADGTAETLGATWVVALLSAVAVRRISSGPAPQRAGHRTERVRVHRGAIIAVPVLAMSWIPATGTSQPVADDTVLFIVPGVSTESGRGTMFTLDPSTIGFTCDRTFYFSYAGPGDGAPQRDATCPIRSGAPYDESHSQAPLPRLRRAFREQVRRLPGAAVVITHSQGAWIAADTLARHPRLEVEVLAMLGAYPVHDVGYAPRDGEPSPRRAAVRGVLRAVRWFDDPGFRADAPLARQLLAEPGAIDRIMSNPLPGVRSLTVTSWYDLVAMPRGWRVPGAHNSCPVFVPHGSLPRSGTVAEVITDFLGGEERSGCSRWRTALASVAAPFTVPADPGHG